MLKDDITSIIIISRVILFGLLGNRQYLAYFKRTTILNIISIKDLLFKNFISTYNNLNET